MTISYFAGGVQNKMICKKAVSKGWCKESSKLVMFCLSGEKQRHWSVSADLKPLNLHKLTNAFE